MARSGKLSKLKCIIKRWNSFSRLTRSTGGATVTSQDDDTWQFSSSVHADEVPCGLHAVYVGKSRRKYLVSSDLVGHPLFRVLVQRSDDSDESPTVVGCEVVLFDHLLWMLDNSDPQHESLDELVEFYAC